MFLTKELINQSRQALSKIIRPDLQKSIDKNNITGSEDSGICWYIYFDDDEEYCMTLSAFWMCADDVLIRAVRLYAVSKEDSPTVALDLTTNFTDEISGCKLLPSSFDDLFAAHFNRLSKITPLLLGKLLKSGVSKPVNQQKVSS